MEVGGAERHGSSQIQIIKQSNMREMFRMTNRFLCFMGYQFKREDILGNQLMAAQCTRLWSSHVQKGLDVCNLIFTCKGAIFMFRTCDLWETIQQTYYSTKAHPRILGKQLTHGILLEQSKIQNSHCLKAQIMQGGRIEHMINPMADTPISRTE